MHIASGQTLFEEVVYAILLHAIITIYAANQANINATKSYNKSK
jgi:hypothetical protein